MSRADRLRGLPLEQVAAWFGYRSDPADKARWKREGSVLGIDGARFYDHLRGSGGAGAIDLALHVQGDGFLQALRTLERIPPAASAEADPAPRPAAPVRLDPALWPRTRDYLVRIRCLDPALLDSCFQRRIAGADSRANAVFVTRCAARNPTGAELRGTRPGPPFKGLAAGTRKSRGGFWIARRKPKSGLVVESAIDALSTASLPELRHIDLFLSTAGVAARLPPWIEPFQLETVLCGYDADEPGDAAARALASRDPRIRRLLPQGHKDWNEVRKSRLRQGAG